MQQLLKTLNIAELIFLLFYRTYAHCGAKSSRRRKICAFFIYTFNNNASLYFR